MSVMSLLGDDFPTNTVSNLGNEFEQAIASAFKRVDNCTNDVLDLVNKYEALEDGSQKHFATFTTQPFELDGAQYSEESIKGTLGKIKDALLDGFKKVIDAIKYATSKVWTTLITFFKNLFRKKDIVNAQKEAEGAAKDIPKDKEAAVKRKNSEKEPEMKKAFQENIKDAQDTVEARENGQKPKSKPKDKYAPDMAKVHLSMMENEAFPSIETLSVFTENVLSVMRILKNTNLTGIGSETGGIGINEIFEKDMSNAKWNFKKLRGGEAFRTYAGGMQISIIRDIERVQSEVDSGDVKVSFMFHPSNYDTMVNVSILFLKGLEDSRAITGMADEITRTAKDCGESFNKKMEDVFDDLQDLIKDFESRDDRDTTKNHWIRRTRLTLSAATSLSRAYSLMNSEIAKVSASRFSSLTTTMLRYLELKKKNAEDIKVDENFDRMMNSDDPIVL